MSGDLETRLWEALAHGAEMASRVGDLLVANTKLTSQLQASEARVRELEAERASLIEGRDANAATYHGHLAAALARAEASEARLAEIEREAERLRDLVRYTGLRSSPVTERGGHVMALRETLEAARSYVERRCLEHSGQERNRVLALIDAELARLGRAEAAEARCREVSAALLEAAETLEWGIRAHRHIGDDNYDHPPEACEDTNDLDCCATLRADRTLAKARAALGKP
jgi:hypothetical protein